VNEGVNGAMKQGIVMAICAIGAVALLAGCVTPPGISNYQRVGRDSLANPNKRAFIFDRDFEQPAHFRIPPGEVAAWFGPLCHPLAHYNCTYFADQDAYYILPDYGTVPSWSVPSHAVVIIDGRTGQVLKSPAKP
jgi:hypothetical protein